MSNKFKALTKFQKHSSKTLQGKIKTRTDHALPIHSNPIELRKTIKEHFLGFEEMQNKLATIGSALRNSILRK